MEKYYHPMTKKIIIIKGKKISINIDDREDLKHYGFLKIENDEQREDQE